MQRNLKNMCNSKTRTENEKSLLFLKKKNLQLECIKLNFFQVLGLQLFIKIGKKFSLKRINKTFDIRNNNYNYLCLLLFNQAIFNEIKIFKEVNDYF